MSSTITIYHNPRCTKSRETLALLREEGVEPEVVEYLKTPPSKARLRELAKLLGNAHVLLRTKEKEYQALGLSPESTTAAIVDAIAEHPILLERPIVVCDGKAAIGRPPESVLRILP
ncbi:MAG: arsenate reductase (glutaredoxin) [Candidatus Hydrogenedentota bacterium]